MTVAIPENNTAFVIWIRCDRRFVRTRIVCPVEQGRMVVAELEAAGISAKLLPVGESANSLLGGAARLGAKSVKVVSPRLHHRLALG